MNRGPLTKYFVRGFFCKSILEMYLQRNCVLGFYQN